MDKVLFENKMKKLERKLYDEVMMPNYAPADFIPVKGSGSLVWDQEGKKYIDFSAGIAVTSLGHCHPKLNQVLKEQSEKLWHLSNIYTFEPSLQCADLLVENSFADQVFFSNSGAEANEAAFKLARRYAHDAYGEDKNQIVSFKQGFHGRTFFTVSVGGQEKYSSGFGPIPGAISHVDFNDLKAIKSVMSEKTCAVVIELIQGEGGVVVADPKFVKNVESLCKEFNALLVVDEVQTGIGRTGKLFAYEHYNIKPDIITLAKALGNGYPVAATLATKKVAESFSFGTHGSTYGGNPIACAVASEVLSIINDPVFLEGVVERNELVVDRLETINQKFKVFSDIRGMGLLIGAELADAHKGKAKDFFSKMREKGLLALVAGPDVLRLAPALNIPLDELEEGLSIVEESIGLVIG